MGSRSFTLTTDVVCLFVPGDCDECAAGLVGEVWAERAMCLRTKLLSLLAWAFTFDQHFSVVLFAWNESMAKEACDTGWCKGMRGSTSSKMVYSR